MSDPSGVNSGEDRGGNGAPYERAEQAFRQAIETMPLSAEVDPAAARARAIRRRSTGRIGAGLAMVVIMVLAVMLIPHWVDRARTDVARPADPAATGYRDPAPSGWRTEQYRDVTFQVPDSWGYGFEPGSDWCVGTVGAPTPRRERYVALGSPTVVASIACPPIPASLITEHVVAGPPTAVNTTEKINGLWVAIGAVNGVEVRAYSADRDLARRIAGSAAPATTDAPCRPTTSVDPQARPVPAFDLARTTVTGDGIVCQYSVHEGRPLADLRAVARLPRPELSRLVDRVAGSAQTDYRCSETVVGSTTDIVLTVTIPTVSGMRTLALRAGSCGDQDSTTFGGFDDGLHVYRVTKATCHAVLIEPARLDAGSGEIGRNCVGT